MSTPSQDEAKTHPLGWRAKIGVIIPTVNAVTEPEFNRMAPDGVTTHFTRMPIHFHPEEDGFRSLLDDLSIRLDELKTCGSTAVAYNCTVGSMACPTELLNGHLEKVSGAPAVSTAASVIAALKALGVKRLAFASPYTEEVNQHEKEYLEAAGFEVVAMAGYNFGDGPERGKNYAAVPPDEVMAHARSVDRPDAEAIFISCANFGSASVAGALEAELGKPVVTSNIATFWAALRAAGIDDPIPGYGRLLTEH